MSGDIRVKLPWEDRTQSLAEYLAPGDGEASGSVESAALQARNTAKAFGKLMARLYEKCVLEFDECKDICGMYGGEIIDPCKHGVNGECSQCELEQFQSKGPGVHERAPKRR